ncbi:MAG: MBL fold metallo-hydrolase [bacterium]
MHNTFCFFKWRAFSFVCLSALNCAAQTQQTDKPHHTPDGFRNVYETEENDFFDFLKWRWQRAWKKIPGPERVAPLGLLLKDLPPIDIVVISHDHYDALDERTILKLLKRPGGYSDRRLRTALVHAPSSCYA